MESGHNRKMGRWARTRGIHPPGNPGCSTSYGESLVVQVQWRHSAKKLRGTREGQISYLGNPADLAAGPVAFSTGDNLPCTIGIKVEGIP